MSLQSFSKFKLANCIRWSFVFSLVFIVIEGHQAFAYDQTDRFQLLEDRNMIQRRITNETSRNGFYFNLSSHISSIGMLLDSGSVADSESAYTNLYSDVQDKELGTFINFEVIVPFRTIRLEEFELTPKFYLRADVGSLTVGQGRVFSKDEFDAWVLNFYSDSSDRETIREILGVLAQMPNGGENVFQHFIDEGVCNTSTLLTFCQTKRDAANAPVMPSDSDEKIFLYSKSQYKVGMLWDFMIVDDWTGYINIYGLQRGDALIVLDDNSAAAAENKPLSQLFNADNSQQFVMIDAKFQLNLRPFKFHFLMEELKITRWKDNIDTAGNLFYRNTSLYQFYASYTAVIENMVVRPFSGFHKRRGYDLIDGLFVGVDFKNNKTGSRFRIMADKENLSFMPSAKMGKTDLIYQIHIPYSSTVENSITTEAIHSLKVSVEI